MSVVYGGEENSRVRVFVQLPSCVGEFSLFRLEVTQAISTCFSAWVDLFSSTRIVAKETLRESALVGFGDNINQRHTTLAGMITDVEFVREFPAARGVDEGSTHRFWYRVRVASKLEALAYFHRRTLWRNENYEAPPNQWEHDLERLVKAVCTLPREGLQTADLDFKCERLKGTVTFEQNTGAMLKCDTPMIASVFQYDESDLDFLTRVTAQYGAFWFSSAEQQDDGVDMTEKLIFSVNKDSFPQHPRVFKFKSGSCPDAPTTADEEADFIVYQVGWSQGLVQDKVSLRDWNYYTHEGEVQTSTSDLQIIGNSTSFATLGENIEYDTGVFQAQYFRPKGGQDPVGARIASDYAKLWGKTIAERRFHARQAHKRCVTGVTPDLSLWAGMSFKVVWGVGDDNITGTAEHDDAPSYIATKTVHSCQFTPPELAPLMVGDLAETRSFCKVHFEAIEVSAPYHPVAERAEPRISGFLRGSVVPAGDFGAGKRPDSAKNPDKPAPSPLSQEGFYSVKLPGVAMVLFGGTGQSTREPDAVLLPMPLATLYGGKNVGVHFPLLADTTVLVAFNNGDPNQPSIIGVAPDYNTQTSLVGQETASVNEIRTRSGLIMRFKD